MLTPSSWCLLKTIECPFESTNMMWRPNKFERRSHKYFFRKKTIQKSILHIKLKNGPLSNCSLINECTNSCHLYNYKSKSFFIINSIFLILPFCNKSSFIVVNRTIKLSFDFEDSFATNCMLSWRNGNNIPSLFLLKSYKLIYYSQLPLRRGNNLFVWLGFC